MNLRKDHHHDLYQNLNFTVRCASVSGASVVRPASVVNPFHNVSRIVDVYLLYSNFTSQFLAMDASARITMKDAAKCDRRREWQNSANQKNAERILHCLVTPSSMSCSGRKRLNATKGRIVSGESFFDVRRCVSMSSYSRGH